MRRSQRLRSLLAFAIGLILISGIHQTAKADGETGPPEQGISNESCYACHASPGLQIELDSGELLYLTIERNIYDNSVHGELGYACVQCHTNITGFPHPERPGDTRRTLSLELYTSCSSCHSPDLARSTGLAVPNRAS